MTDKCEAVWEMGRLQDGLSAARLVARLSWSMEDIWEWNLLLL